MRVLVTGASGYLGGHIFRHLRRKFEVVGTCHSKTSNVELQRCDLRDVGATNELAERTRPSLVIHAAGDKDVLACETDPGRAEATNAAATGNVAAAFHKYGRVVYISTDYVFDGAHGYYSEASVPRPRTEYGRSKLAGESRGYESGGGRFLVLRTAAVFGGGVGLLARLREAFAARRIVDCFVDAYYSPTYLRDLLEGIDAIMAHEGRTNLFHLAGARTSRYEFAVAAAQAWGAGTDLIRPATRTPREWFLFPDLSMIDAESKRILGVGATPHLEALRRLSAEGTEHADHTSLRQA